MVMARLEQVPQSLLPRPLPVRILDEFEARASQRGIRAVVMSELARDLGISTKTLYREYATKSELVSSLIDRWIHAIASNRVRRLVTIDDPVERITVAAQLSLDHTDAISADFWRDLRRDHPDDMQRYTAAVDNALLEARDWLATEVRPEVDVRLAGPLLLSLLRSAVDPQFCDGVGVTRHQAAAAAVEIWARGALRSGS
jgi:AcrR family transcriptional regulator